ncbi:hypothetical protein SDC9_179621 [bioreactor metagenome]|uniref:Uncharacterized protein n=1 Tax=bioreactor metagenome TaxID=1076179 RepID=A0A645GZA9_9ZZZZ
MPRPAESQPSMVPVRAFIPAEAGVPVDAGKDAGHTGVEGGVNGEGRREQRFRKRPQRLLNILPIAATVSLEKGFVVVESQFN